jgi:hypothetical protein
MSTPALDDRTFESAVELRPEQEAANTAHFEAKGYQIGVVDEGSKECDVASREGCRMSKGSILKLLEGNGRGRLNPSHCRGSFIAGQNVCCPGRTGHCPAGKNAGQRGWGN